MNASCANHFCVSTDGSTFHDGITKNAIITLYRTQKSSQS